jgi:SAM-dependent methyltransferase
MPAKNSTTRFSSRVDDYIKYRPHYPAEIIDLLADKCGLTPESVIADIGSGTGILTKLFLENGNPVVGVEPNREMREGGESYLAEFARFTSVEGTSEATRLPPQSMDFILAAQAFHWFDQTKTRAEFQRILKPNGWVVLIWNDRRTDSTPFLRDYEALLQEFGNDYKEIEHKNVRDENVFIAFFGAPPAAASFDNAQRVDFEGLIGRLNSASYMPGRGDARHAAMVAHAREIFTDHAVNGRVAFEYDTRVFYGNLHSESR